MPILNRPITDKALKERNDGERCGIDTTLMVDRVTQVSDGFLPSFSSIGTEGADPIGYAVGRAVSVVQLVPVNRLQIRFEFHLHIDKHDCIKRA